jgi:hypothetical protein
MGTDEAAGAFVILLRMVPDNWELSIEVTLLW